MVKPIIGITVDCTADTDRNNVFNYNIRSCYAKCIRKYGGIPVLLPYNNCEDILNIVNGLVISGGDLDVHPKYYNHNITSDKIKIDETRTCFELDLLDKALNKNIPIFGICNGMQIINVLYGGTLIQHLPDIVKSDINHEQPHPKNVPTHDIIINNKSIIFDLNDKKNTACVNSTHHQAVDKVGNGLLLAAKAPDGVVEAIEDQKRNFVIGVQWHSEYLNTKIDEELFKRFIRAC